MRPPHKSAPLVAGLAAVALMLAMAAGATAAPPVPEPAPSGKDASTRSQTDPPRAVVPLAKGDTAAIAVGGTDGVEILTPNPPEVGGFRALTRLWVEGWDNVPWTENNCTTGDGRFMAVVFAPVPLINRRDKQPNAGFGAVVNLQTGARWILPYRVSLAYHTPGCGVGSEIAFQRSTGDASTGTDIIRVDAAKSRVMDLRHVTSQLTSAVPVADKIIAAQGDSLVSVSAAGSVTRLTKEAGPLYDVRPATKGNVDYLVKASNSEASARKYAGSGKTVSLGVGPLTGLDLFGGNAGRNHLVGKFTPTALNDLDVINADKRPVALSQRGSVVITDEQIPGVTARTDAPGMTIGVRGRASTEIIHAPVRVPPSSEASSPADNVPSAGVVPTAAPPGGSTAPLRAAAAAGVSPCAVAPLDPGTQIIQPSPKQVERAANRAVRGLLTDARPANWQKHGLPAYTPQSLFPVPALVGGGHIPVQVLEGVLAQESNFNQASFHALPGVAGNPLIGNYYGLVYDATGHIVSSNFANADCGYGLGQITTHMTTADTTWSPTLKRQIAVDYQVNIAAAVSFLANAWNLLNAAPRNIKMNDGNPNKIENWYATLWAYNSGVQPGSPQYGNTTGCTPGPTCTNNGDWGLGWTNNPAQNDYDPSRLAFLSAGYGDASQPWKWPYQEKVLGWAQYPQQDFVNGGAKYKGSARLGLPTYYFGFCSPTLNNCSATSAATGFCLSTNRNTCWWHSPLMWMPATGGTFEDPSAYVAGAAEPGVPNPYPPSCSVAASPVVSIPGMTAVPAGAVVVDDLPSSSTNRAGCATVASSGTFSMVYGQDALGNPQGAIDTHQIGTGYMGHSYFAHTIAASRPSALATGTWTPPSTVLGWQRIWVHLPDNGAVTFQADYKIFTGTQNLHRVVNQRWNKNSWFDLGSFQLSAGAKVSLSNATHGDFAVEAIDISWDALAFTPSAKPAVAYVAFGDSYQAGEGVEPYYANADNGGGGAYTNACHRSPQAYPSLVFGDLKAAHPGNAEFHFQACSGAVTDDVLPGGTEEFHEVPQLDTGWLDVNTTHVTVGIGGNDARFSAILKGCIMTITPCLDPGYRLTVEGVVDPLPLVQWEPQLIESLATPLGNVLAAIRSRAPNAQIAVVGYPHVIATGLRRVDVDCQIFDQPEVSFFAQMGDRLNTVTAAVALSAGASYVNPAPTFAAPPSHEACAFAEPGEWSNAAVLFSNSGSGLKTPGAGSFHPTAAGHQAVRGLVRGALQ
jgi:GDSL-like Lipase/Acylhydrolase family